MKLESKSLPRQTVFSLLIMAVISAVSIGLLAIAMQHYSNASSKTGAILTQQDQLHAEMEELQQNKQDFESSKEMFAAIKAQGFFGEEDRLSWGEALSMATDNLDLPQMKYSIRPQKTVQDLGGDYMAELNLTKSVMDIDAGLPHEADFISISKRLSKLPGLFQVQSCELAKRDEIVLHEADSNITLKCSLAWYTARQKAIDTTFEDDDFDLDDF